MKSPFALNENAFEKSLSQAIATVNNRRQQSVGAQKKDYLKISGTLAPN